MTSVSVTAPRSRGLHVWRATRETALTVGAVLGVAGMLLAVAHAAFGITPMVVRSGSMEPEIMTGALVVTHEVTADDVSPGDVVTVRDDQGNRITHRVVTTVPTGSGAYALTLRGDANPSDDPAPYVVSTVDRVVLDIPYAGYVASVLVSPGTWLLVASVLLGAYALGLRSREDTGVR